MKMVTIEDYAEIRCRGCKKPMGLHMTTRDLHGRYLHSYEEYELSLLRVWCPPCWQKATEMSK